jgi:hypothetical protein
MTKKKSKKPKIKTTITFELAILGGGALKDPQDKTKREKNFGPHSPSPLQIPSFRFNSKERSTIIVFLK